MNELELSRGFLRDYLDSLRYKYEATPGAWNILGLRSCVPEGDTRVKCVSDQPDRYNDSLVVFGDKAGGGFVCRTFLASVDPGMYWTVGPRRNPRGCAHLMNGQYLYKVGTHNISRPPHKRYQSLVQAGKVKIWRDANADYIRNGADGVETGFFGINIHAGGTRSTVGIESAGCSVIYGGRCGKPWKAFMELVNASAKDRLNYSLTDAADALRFSKFGSKTVEVVASELPEKKKQALQRVLQGMAILYDYQAQADLPAEEDVTFVQLLNRVRRAGILRHVELETRPESPPVESVQAAREKMIEGFRLIYSSMIEAGLDNNFHSQINQLRHFGPL